MLNPATSYLPQFSDMDAATYMWTWVANFLRESKSGLRRRTDDVRRLGLPGAASRCLHRLSVKRAPFLARPQVSTMLWCLRIADPLGRLQINFSMKVSPDEMTLHSTQQPLSFSGHEQVLSRNSIFRPQHPFHKLRMRERQSLKNFLFLGV